MILFYFILFLFFNFIFYFYFLIYFILLYIFYLIPLFNFIIYLSRNSTYAIFELSCNLTFSKLTTLTTPPILFLYLNLI